MRAHRRVLLVCAFAMLVLPASAPAAVRLGPDLTVKPGGGGGLVFAGVGCQSGQYSPCSYVNLRSTSAAAPAESTVGGIVTKWRFRGGCCTDPQTAKKTMTLRTFKRGTHDGDYGYAYAIPSQTGPSFEIPPGNQVLSDPFVELPARMPIAAGERIGIVADNPIEFAVYSPFAGVDAAVFSNGYLDRGEIYGQAFGGTALAISADVEPDADGDLFGDETQDCAPADPSRQDGCAPPVYVPPPPPLSVAVGGGGTPACGTNCPSSGVVFIAPISSVPSGDGSTIYIPLKCPATSTQPCGGYLIVNPPPAKKATASAAKPLARVHYSIAPGATKRLKVQLSKAGRALLKRKHRLVVLVTVQPNSGQPVTTRTTLKWKAPKPAKKHRKH